MEIRSPTHTYEVSYLVGETPKYRLYVCVQNETDRECLLQIVKDRKDNSGLERGAYILRRLKEESDLREAEYVKLHPNLCLNYDLGFPGVIETFELDKEQGYRRVNILEFHNVERLKDITPLHSIRAKDRQRIDAKSAAWILGKTLKTLDLAHSMGISVSGLDVTKIVLETEEHYPIIFDWSQAVTHSGSVPMHVTRQEVMQVARAVISAMGGSFRKRQIPFEGNEDGYSRFTDFLFRLAGGSQPSATVAHEMFYQMVDQIWDPGFHPFTTYSLEEE